MSMGIRGFTLIEVMISIAMLAIFLAIPLSYQSVRYLGQESDYRFALRTARHQIEALRQADFDRLPPEQLPVGKDGWVQLSHPFVLENSLKGARILAVESDSGRVRVAAAAGSTVVLAYTYRVPDRGETHTVPLNSPYEVALRNAPVTRVVQVWEARGASLKPVPAGEWRLVEGRLQLPSRLGGRVVAVDYFGERIGNEVSGVSLDADLKPGPGPFKRLSVRERYGRSTRPRLTLTLLRGAKR